MNSTEILHYTRLGISRNVKYYVKEKLLKLFRGYSNSEWYNFETEHAKYCIIRLKHLRNNLHGMPVNNDIKDITDWQNILDKIILGFESYLELDDVCCRSPEYEKVFNEGMQLFIKYYRDLWD